MHFQADIAPAHDDEKYQANKCVTSGYASFLGNRNSKNGLGFSRIFIFDDDTVTLIMHTVFCLSYEIVYQMIFAV